MELAWIQVLCRTTSWGNYWVQVPLLLGWRSWPGSHGEWLEPTVMRSSVERWQMATDKSYFIGLLVFAGKTPFLRIRCSQHFNCPIYGPNIIIGSQSTQNKFPIIGRRGLVADLNSKSSIARTLILEFKPFLWFVSSIIWQRWLIFHGSVIATRLWCGQKVPNSDGYCSLLCGHQCGKLAPVSASFA